MEFVTDVVAIEPFQAIAEATRQARAQGLVLTGPAFAETLVPVGLFAYCYRIHLSTAPAPAVAS